MSFTIQSGLFGLDFTDHHAILGVPVDAEPKDMRKKYLKLAQRLHPDSCAKSGEEERKRAEEFLSKLVNPSYEKLSKEKNYTEYILLLKLKGQQALRQQETVVLSGEEARKLAAAPMGDIDTAYRKAVKELAEQQYSHLERTLVLTGRISELNLVYLMRKAGKGEFPTAVSQRPADAATATSSGKQGAAPQSIPKTPATREAVLTSYLRRAQELEARKNYPGAIKELRDALQIAPKNGTIHCRLGAVYLQSNQSTMAKIHFRKALELNPQDATAQEGLRRADPAAASSGAAQPAGAKGKIDPNAAKSKAVKPDPKGKPQSGGGLFGLFGGKKK